MDDRLKTLLVLVPGVLLAYWFLAGPSPEGQKEAPPAYAADFTLPDLKGKKTALSDFRGKVVLVDFWATWCGPCIEELPDLIRLHEKNKARGFSMLGISLDDDKKAVAPFAKEHKMSYPVLLAGPAVPAGYSVPGTPTAFLISADGLIVKTYYGAKPYDEVVKDVEELITLAPSSSRNLVK